MFDLVVIGGGITGAGIALDAASRGMKVALLEKDDYASGTSSKSTKLIHGGLRYLKQLEIGLVREVGRERAIVHELAPHLVTSEKMLLPLIEGGTFGELATSMGLWVYDLLAGVEGSDRRMMLSREETLSKEPLLRSDGLKGGGYYAEYRTDDARLTIENLKTAVDKFGATTLNYCQVDDFIYDDEQIAGVKATDKLKGEKLTVRCRFVVSATGPWVDDLRKIDQSLKGKRLFLSKGVHIVVPHQRFPLRQAVYFDIPDGRMIFAIPRQRIVYIGTTDTPYKGDRNNIPVWEEEVVYLLEATNNMFPGIQLTIEDVESSWAGLRPLIHEEGKSASEMSRRDEIFESKTGLISIAGGKLTGYRKMAEKVIDLVAKKYRGQYGESFGKNKTTDIPLSGGFFEDAAAVEQYVAQIEKRIRSYGLNAYRAQYLVSNYGKQTELILDKFQSLNDEAEIALIRAEAWFTVFYESASTLLDFFNRRSGRLFFDLPSIRETKDAVLNDMTDYLEWDATRRELEEQQLDQAILQASVFEKSPDPSVLPKATT